MDANSMYTSAGGGSSLEFPFDDEVRKKIAEQAMSEVKDLRTHKVHVRNVVCEHWIYGLCMIQKDCKFLHAYDLSKMPLCKKARNGVCTSKVKYCPFKHGDSDAVECLFYKQGFCQRGKDCKNHHVPKLKDECPAEANFESMQKKIKVADPTENMKVTLCSMNLMDPVRGCVFGADRCHFAHGEEDIREGQLSGNDILQDDDIYDPTRNRLDANRNKKMLIIRFGGDLKDISLKTYKEDQYSMAPFSDPGQCKIEYFLIQAPDLPTLAKARRLEYWQVARKTGEELNEAYRRCDHVLLFFSVRLMKGLYGLARLDSPVPPPFVGSDFTREFPIRWMRTFRISMRTVAQMKTAVTLVSQSYNNETIETRLHIGKARGDCLLGQNEEERRKSQNDKSYDDILRIAYRKPEWDWTVDLERASRIRDVKILFPSDLLTTALSSLSSSAAAATTSSSTTNGTDENLMQISSVVSTSISSSSTALTVVDASVDKLFSKNWEREIIKASYEMLSKVHDRRTPKTTFYKGDKGGFMCCGTGAFIDEMFSKRLMGFNPSKQNAALEVGTPIFVINTDQNLYEPLSGHDIYGIFQCVSEPKKEDIVMDNYTYPYQVRLECVVKLEYPIKHKDPDVQKIFSKSVNIGGSMTHGETVELCEVFAHRGKLVPDLSQVAQPSSGGGGLHNLPFMPVGSEWASNNFMAPNGLLPPGGTKRGTGDFYKPPFPFNGEVPEGGIGGGELSMMAIKSIKQKVIGINQASNLIKIITDAGGDKKTSKIQMRGIGSGLNEGPMQQELQQPLYFHVSAANEPLLKAMLARLSAEVTKAVAEQRSSGVL